MCTWDSHAACRVLALAIDVSDCTVSSGERATAGRGGGFNLEGPLYNIQTWQTCFGRSCADGRFVVEYVSVGLVGRSGSVVLCTAGLEDMAVALSPGKCGSYRQILSNNSVSRWLRCRVSLILGTSTTICKTSKCGRG